MQGAEHRNIICYGFFRFRYSVPTLRTIKIATNVSFDCRLLLLSATRLEECTKGYLSFPA